MIKCSACGHDWIEGKAIEVSREIKNRSPTVIESGFEPDFEIRRLVDATRKAQEVFAQRKKLRRKTIAAWLGLALFVTSPVAYALAYPAAVVRFAPATVAAYEWMGREINIYGLRIRKIEMQHLSTAGKRVVAIRGEILNTSSEPRKIPWLRFGLKDAGNSEVYSWQLDTNARPLNAGESTNFVTRIASPPEIANHVEIRFARADEISSNANP
jgi:hypothetical protein